VAIARVKVWIANEVLTASDLNAEFNNLVDNSLSAVSPWTANMDAGGFRLITLGAGTVGSPTLQPTGDTNTGVFFPAADQVSLVGAGGHALLASGYLNAANYVRAAAAPATYPPSLSALGTDTNVALRLIPQGTGYVLVSPGGIAGSRFVAGLAAQGDEGTGLTWVTNGTLDLIGSQSRILRAIGSQGATNYVTITASPSPASPTISVSGGDSSIGLQITTSGGGALTLGAVTTGGITAATYFVPAAIPGGTPNANALYTKNVPKAWISFSSVPALLDSYNITSLTDEPGAGDVSITFDRDFLAVNYCVLVGNSVGGGSTTHMSVSDWTVGGVRVRITDMANTLFDASGYLAFFGAQ